MGLGEIAHPTLLIGGRQDAVFAVPEQEDLARVIGMGKVRLRLYRYSGHSPHWEEPGRLVENIERFLAG